MMVTAKDQPVIQEKEKDFLTKAAKKILQKAKQHGATSAEASLRLDIGYSVNVRMGEVETLEFHRDKVASVTVYIGKKQGSATTSDLTDDALTKAVAAACSIAQATGEDPYAGLAEKELLAYKYPDLHLCHPWDLSVEDAITLAKKCENEARNYDPRITNSEGASVSNVESFRVYANSNDFLGAYGSTSHGISCSLVAQQGDSMQRDYDYTVARDARDLLSVHDIAKSTAERTLRRLGAKPIPTCKVPVIFSAEVARGLFGHFVAATSGGALYRKASFLLDKISQQVFSEHFMFEEQPHIEKGLASAPFDAEGVATHPRFVVLDGILQGYFLSSYSARKLGMTTTGNAGGVHNLLIKSKEQLNFKQLLKKMEKGLLVTEVMGQGVNIVTGDYSRGVAGFWVEHGEIQYPVEGITIAGNLRDMFLNLVAVSNDIDRRGSIQTGSVLLEQMTIAGI